MCGLITCWRAVEVKSGQYAPISGRGPEYETCAAFGSLCMNTNLESIAKANDLCITRNRHSAGVSIAFAMECFEKGIVYERKPCWCPWKSWTGDIVVHKNKALARDGAFTSAKTRLLELEMKALGQKVEGACSSPMKK